MVSISSGASVRVCVYVRVCVSVCISLGQMSLHLLTMSGCCEVSHVGSMLDSADMDF